jgi:hypothetical protein
LVEKHCRRFRGQSKCEFWELWRLAPR